MRSGAMRRDMGDRMAPEGDKHNGSGAAGDVVERSALLEATYNEVLTLISRTADFVGAMKNGAVSGFDLGVGAAYTVESMRHTTRLMQAMAWLLTQRAVESGEMTADEAQDPKYRLGAPEICLAHPMAGTDLLPKHFRDMIAQSEQIYRRLRRIAAQMERPTHAHPVHDLMNRLGSDSSDDWMQESPDDVPPGLKH